MAKEETELGDCMFDFEDWEDWEEYRHVISSTNPNLSEIKELDDVFDMEECNSSIAPQTDTKPISIPCRNVQQVPTSCSSNGFRSPKLEPLPLQDEIEIHVPPLCSGSSGGFRVFPTISMSHPVPGVPQMSYPALECHAEVNVYPGNQGALGSADTAAMRSPNSFSFTSSSSNSTDGEREEEARRIMAREVKEEYGQLFLTPSDNVIIAFGQDNMSAGKWSVAFLLKLLLTPHTPTLVNWIDRRRLLLQVSEGRTKSLVALWAHEEQTVRSKPLKGTWDNFAARLRYTKAKYFDFAYKDKDNLGLPKKRVFKFAEEVRPIIDHLDPQGAQSHEFVHTTRGVSTSQNTNTMSPDNQCQLPTSNFGSVDTAFQIPKQESTHYPVSPSNQGQLPTSHYEHVEAVYLVHRQESAHYPVHGFPAPEVAQHVNQHITQAHRPPSLLQEQVTGISVPQFTAEQSNAGLKQESPHHPVQGSPVLEVKKSVNQHIPHAHLPPTPRQGLVAEISDPQGTAENLMATIEAFLGIKRVSPVIQSAAWCSVPSRHEHTMLIDDINFADAPQRHSKLHINAQPHMGLFPSQPQPTRHEVTADLSMSVRDAQTSYLTATAQTPIAAVPTSSSAAERTSSSSRIPTTLSYVEDMDIEDEFQGT